MFVVESKIKFKTEICKRNDSKLCTCRCFVNKDFLEILKDNWDFRQRTTEMRENSKTDVFARLN